MIKKIFLISQLLFSMVGGANEFTSVPSPNALSKLDAKRLWPTERGVSPEIYSLVRFLDRRCREFEVLNIPYSTSDESQQCAFIKIIDIQEQLMANISELDYVDLPPRKEWSSIFAGIVAPIYDFGNTDKKPLHLISNIILNQIAIESGVRASLDVEGPMFKHIEYPAIMASLFPGERLTYYLRAAKLTKCQNTYFSCEKIGDLSKDETRSLLNRLYVSINSTLAEIKKTSQFSFNFENWLLGRVEFSNVINRIRQDNFRADFHLENINKNIISSENQIVKTALGDISLFHLGLPDSRLVKAYLALMELSEVFSLLSDLGYPHIESTVVVDEDHLKTSVYTEKMMIKLNQLRNIFQLQ